MDNASAKRLTTKF